MNHIFFSPHVADYSYRRWRSSNGPELNIIDASLCSLMCPNTRTVEHVQYTYEPVSVQITVAETSLIKSTD